MSADDVSSPPLDSGVDNIADRLGGLNTADGGVIERPQNDEEYGQAQLTLRAIVTSKEAGVIIGKAGQNVADLRDKTGVRAGVSKVVQGVHDRVLTVTGALNGVGHAYGLVADCLLKGAPQVGMGGIVASPNTHREYSTYSKHPREHLLTKASYPTPHLAQPDGNHHWASRSQD